MSNFRCVLSKALDASTPIAAILGVAIISLLAPSPASAESVRPPWSFSLAGSNGYSFFVSAGGHHAVEVLVSKRGTFIEYDSSATVKGDLVEATIGQLGEIKMKFVPSGLPTRSGEPNGCRGPRPTVQKGHVIGTFQFRGERGYTSASTNRARAFSERGFTGICQGGGHPEVPNLVARSTSRTRSTSIAEYFREYEVATHAEIAERVGSLKIFRTIGFAAPLSAASIEPDGSIKFSPPAPFAGSVLYTARPSGGGWTGDLSAIFPGLGRVSLAGPRFRATVLSPLPPATP